MAARAPFRFRPYGGLAAVLAAGLGSVWAWQDRAALMALRLPDTDDAARLQQVRDWLGGQAFADLSQHRLGAPPGLAMHWSRVADLAPAALNAMLKPAFGTPIAERIAVIAVPILLFACVLLLIARLGWRTGSSPTTTMLVASLAYPATTIFLPGRIDHHGLQMLLLLVAATPAIAPPPGRRAALGEGIAAGLAGALSIAIGLETAPLLALAAAIVAWRWLRQGRAAAPLLAGQTVALVLGLTAAAALLRPLAWDYPACDGFTVTAWRAAMLGATGGLALAAVALAGTGPRTRALALVAAAAAVPALVIAVAPACRDPYGAVDPVLARQWLAQVAEAQSVRTAPATNAIGYLGLAITGLAAAAWGAMQPRDAAGEAPDADGLAARRALALLLAGALLLALATLRGAYAAALLAAPALAAMIDAARRRGWLLVPAWVASAGILYPIAAAALIPAASRRAAADPADAAAAARDCTDPAALARIAALPPGVLVAPIDLSGFALAATPHRLLAGPYHRNREGNRAMFDFFQGPAARSETIARAWGIDYVAFCPGVPDEPAARAPGAASPDTLAAALDAGRPPAWLAPIDAARSGPRLYRIVRSR